MKLSFLKNNDPLIEQRMRFFESVFYFINEFLGRLPSFPFDTPSSLINKLQYQLRYNKEKYWLEYASIYINDFIQFFGHYFPFEEEPLKSLNHQLLLPWKEASTPEKRLQLLKQANLILLLEQVEADLNTDLFPKTIEALYGVIACPNKDHDHHAEIIRYTHVIVALFRLQSIPRVAVNNFISRILSKNHNTYPFAKEIFDLAGDRLAFLSAKQDFLANRNFRQQLEGLHNIYLAHTFKNGVFIFCLKDTVFPAETAEQIDVTFERTRIVAASHPDFLAIKAFLQKTAAPKTIEEAYPDFFQPYTLLAVVPCSYDKFQDSKTRMLAMAQSDLDEFNNTVGSSCFIHLYDYIFTESLQQPLTVNVNGQSAMHWLDQNDMLNLKENAYAVLKNKTGDAAAQLIRNEQTFAQAWKNQDLSGFWQYLENIFWKNDFSKALIKENSIKLFMDTKHKILSHLEQHMGRLFHALELHGHLDEVGISENDRDYIYTHAGLKSQPVDWETFRASFKIPFLTYMLDQYAYYQAPASANDWKAHFNSLIHELKDFRNSHVHAGITNPFSEIKLRNCIPSLINNIRWHLIQQCPSQPTKTSDDE